LPDVVPAFHVPVHDLALSTLVGIDLEVVLHLFDIQTPTKGKNRCFEQSYGTIEVGIVWIRKNVRFSPQYGVENQQ